MTELTTEAVAAVLTAAGGRPAARHESGWTVTADGGAVLVGYKAAGKGEAVMKREALARWARAIGTAGQGWTVEGIGLRRLDHLRVTAPGGGAR